MENYVGVILFWVMVAVVGIVWAKGRPRQGHD